ncbi:MBL fold metallo-hydrolase [Kitasatospora kifunensis]|uniref:Glyoxylase-like metal-dependent hydrolase (Beta-lactamase superfamily II) n=1 Tax=Kitasatospora kifunensis TaxID=58351 RepID=A0A7W7VZK8_KITKI|nr:MBL fold metallo-hydrolase [Kitasatospora kifunensis]MBB4928902.1 glyoxylase-like metal-dependent hydrolase (beta-lactamase superfamily II) [Kitasatospora kifunensis]
MPRTTDRITIGETSISYLIDGHGVHNPDTMMPGVDWSAHPGSLEDGQLILTFGSFLIRAGTQKILVDLALGEMDVNLPGLAHVKGGRLLQSLAAEGLSPDDIDTVVYTHLHLDHIGWTSDVAPVPNTPKPKSPSGLTFARARHLMAEAEWRHWTTEAAGEMGGPDAEATIKPLDGVVEFIGNGDTIAPGITVEDTSGHTPGHLAVVVRDPSGASTESVFIAGDIFHAPVELADPTCVFSSDVNPGQARAVRNRVLQRPDTVIAAGHFTNGVFGRVTPTGGTYTWTPVGHPPTSR